MLATRATEVNCHLLCETYSSSRYYLSPNHNVQHLSPSTVRTFQYEVSRISLESGARIPTCKRLDVSNKAICKNVIRFGHFGAGELLECCSQPPRFLGYVSRVYCIHYFEVLFSNLILTFPPEHNNVDLAIDCEQYSMSRCLY